MKIRYLLLIALAAVLLVIVGPASWGQPPSAERATGGGPNAGEKIVGTGSRVPGHWTQGQRPPLPDEEVTGPGVQAPLAGWTNLMTENFEGVFPSTGWTVFDNDGATSGEYYWDDDDYKPHWGSRSAWCARGGLNGFDPEYDYYPNDAWSWMVYGPFNLSGYSDAELLFYYWNQSESNWDKFSWAASTNGTDYYGYSVSGGSSGWQYVNFDLTSVSGVTGASQVWIAFIFESDGSVRSYGAYVDDVTLRAYQAGYQEKVYVPLGVSGYPPQFGFLPEPDGYSFPNYGNSHTWQDDLGAADLINMFGAGNVCASGSTPADCVLTSAAETWRQYVLNMAGGGHCEGMATTCLRFFKGQTYYTGDTTPGDFQGGAQRVYDLGRDQSVDNYIAYYFVLQTVEEVWYPTGLIRVNNTPKQIFELIREALESGDDPYTLGIYKYDNGSLTMGHAITPYNIVDKGGGTYWLYVYDNNYPGQANHIVFETNADTWYYTSNYNGDADTKNLDLTRISWRNQEPFTCPFGVTASAVEFWLTGGGDMLISDVQGRHVGYDPATGQMVNEIPDAHIVYLKGVQSPVVRLPLQEPDELYDVTVSGQTIAKAVSTDLVMVGPGYVVGFDGIQLHPDQALEMSLSADGRQLLFAEGQTAQPPRTFTSMDDVAP